MLVKCKKVMKNKINLNGQTPLEMLEGQVDTRATESALHQSGGGFKTNTNHPRQSLAESLRKESSCLEKLQQYLARQNNKISNDMRNAMLVVAALISTASFQACLSPPGGLLQGDGNSNNTIPTNSNVGVSVTEFGFVYAINTATFLTSTCIMFFLLPDEGITALTVPLLLFVFCYVNSVIIISPYTDHIAVYLLLALCSCIFVSWPKSLDLYYRRRPRYFSGALKSAYLTMLFFLLAVYLFAIIASRVKDYAHNL